MLEGYQEDKFGIIKKIGPIDFDYGKAYQDRLLSRGEGNTRMAYLRYGYLRGWLVADPVSILDVGYGDGEFLKVCARNPTIACYGNELDGSAIPAGCTFVADITDRFYDVICFFDSLEHFENLDFLGGLKCHYIFLSIPNCVYYSDEWFESWFHRKPEQHVWNFSRRTLQKLMLSYGYHLMTFSYIENMIRDSGTDILTLIFEKQ